MKANKGISQDSELFTVVLRDKISFIGICVHLMQMLPRKCLDPAKVCTVCVHDSFAVK